MKFITEEDVYKCKDHASDYDGHMAITYFSEILEKEVAKHVIQICANKAKEVMLKRSNLSDADAVYQSVMHLIRKNKL